VKQFKSIIETAGVIPVIQCKIDIMTLSLEQDGIGIWIGDVEGSFRDPAGTEGEWGGIPIDGSGMVEGDHIVIPFIP
jgi:hypothetical protein